MSDPIQLRPGDPTPDGPHKDDDWCRFYGPDPGSEHGTTHFEVHEYCDSARCQFRDEPCPWHPDDCHCGCKDPVGIYRTENTSMIETTITGIKRLTNTKSGNPRWEVSTPAGTWKTKPDAADAGLLHEYVPGRECRITLEGNLIKYIAVWTEFPDGSSEWYGQQS